MTATGAAARARAQFALGPAFGVVALDIVMVGGAGPRIAADLRGVDLLGWLFTAFLLAWTVTGPIFGKLADIHINVPSESTPRVQEVHRTLLHVICDLVERAFVDQ